MFRSAWLACAAMCGMALSSAAMAATFVNIKPSGCQHRYCSSEPVAINAADQIVGTEGNSAYIWNPDGTFHEFTVPNSGETTPAGINNKGQVAGTYEPTNGVAAGFLRQPHGKFVTFSHPNSTFTTVSGLNDSGDIVGAYETSNSKYRGFLRKASGRFVDIRVPMKQARYTFPISINSDGAVAGIFRTRVAVHGFVRAPDGTITTFDPGGSSMSVARINDNGVIAGTFVDINGLTHGYIRNTDGSFTQIDVPLATVTNLASINIKGDVVGTYMDLGEGSHAFMRLAGGSFVKLDDHPRLFRYTASSAVDVNDLRAMAGEVSSFGYLRLPTH